MIITIIMSFLFAITCVLFFVELIKMCNKTKELKKIRVIFADNKNRNKLKKLRKYTAGNGVKVGIYFLYKQSNSVLTTNDFFSKNSVLLVVDKKTIELHKTIKLYNNNYMFFCVKRQNSKSSVVKAMVQNKTSKLQKISFINKFNICIKQPTLFYDCKGKVCYISYNGNNIVSNIRVNTKLSSAIIINKNDKEIVIIKQVELKPHKKVLITINNTFLLQCSTMQSAMQNKVLQYNKPNNVDIDKYAKEMFNYKITTANKYINTLINIYLPKKIINEYKENNIINNLYNYVFSQDIEGLDVFGYKAIIDWLLKRKEYARLYKYLLNSLLGIKVMGKILYFSVSNNYIGKIIINIKDIIVIKYNVLGAFYFTYNNIIYKNVNILNIKEKFIELTKCN